MYMIKTARLFCLSLTIFLSSHLATYLPSHLSFSLYGAFEDFSSSPRILSLGGAFVALSDDASATNTNPAGLVQLQKTELIASYSNMYNADGLFRGHLAMATPVEVSAVGLSFNRLSLPGIYDEDIFSLALARQLSDHISVGISIKLLTNEVYNFNASFYKGRKYLTTYDIGILYQLTDSWIFGLSGYDLNEPLIAEGEKNNSFLKVGVRYHPFESGLVVFDYDTFEREIAVGFEVVVGELLPLRLGLKNLKPTFGFGIEHKFINFDFAILSDKNLGLLSQIGVRVKI